jgi:hypothetical protein
MYTVAPQVPRIREVFAKPVRPVERTEVIDRETFRLKTSFENLKSEGDQASGDVVHDIVITIPYRDTFQHVRTTMEGSFVFDLESKMRPHLFIFGKEQDTISGVLDTALFGGDRGIAFTSIAPPKILQFTKSHAAKILWASFKGLNIPNLNKSSLWGPDLATTQDYDRYCAHGQNHYVMIELKGQHWVVAIGSDGKAIMYSKVSQADFLEFLKTEVVPILK